MQRAQRAEDVRQCYVFTGAFINFHSNEENLALFIAGYLNENYAKMIPTGIHQMIVSFAVDKARLLNETRDTFENNQCVAEFGTVWFKKMIYGQARKCQSEDIEA